jgi:dCTP deaminase
LIKKGVLSDQHIKKLIIDGQIKADKKIKESQIQPSSIDLRLGTKGYRIRSSFLPQGSTVKEILKDLKMYEIDLTRGVILEKGNIYLIPLMERLELTPLMSGRTNPKSSTGRLDIFTRVITDRCYRFEDIQRGYSGRLYLEIVPKSFTVRVTAGLSLNQLRIFKGVESDRGLRDSGERVTDSDLLSYYDHTPLLFNEEGSHVPKEKLVIMDGLYMGINLKEKLDNIIGYKAKKNSAIIDLEKIREYEVQDYWEPMHAPKDNYLILEPEEFYIFASKEKIRVPLNLAGEMVEFDAGSGELRTHYAGFFDCGFGYGKEGEIKGTKAVLEVRPHDVPFRIEDGQIFCKLKYERMISEPLSYYGCDIGSHYHSQSLALSKHFK